MSSKSVHGAAARLRKRLADGSLVVAPGAPDALAARQIEMAGYDAVYMTGLGATASRLGAPDLGLLTQTEMADQARAMVRATALPVVADADTGYGGPLNMRRTVHEYLQVGVAAMHIEDQASPKQCGQLAGVRLVARDEAALRLKAAIDARDQTGGDVVIIGRTDALQPEGLDAAIARARAYRDAGVDLLFVDGVRTRAEVEGIARGLEGPKVVSIVDGTDAARLTRDEIRQMGFAMVLYPLTVMLAAMRASREALSRLRESGLTAGPDTDYGYADYAAVVGLPEHQRFAHDHET